MLKGLLLLCILIVISCSNNPSITDSQTPESKTQVSNLYIGTFKTEEEGNQRIEINHKTNAIRYYNIWGDYAEMQSTGPKNVPILNVKAAQMNVQGEVGAKNYRTKSGACGKTYTEEFKDLEGNTRTRVYENGLLVSYKINGVEQ